MNRRNAIYQNERSEVVMDENGNVLEERETSSRTVKLPPEPHFVKLYLDCLSRFKGMQLSLNPILMAMLDKADYSDKDKGMLIFLNKALKDRIAEKCGVSLKRVEQAITEFVKKGIVKRIAVGTYEFNPYLFGKGSWEHIYNIRAEFDFKNGEIMAEIVHEEEEKMSENQGKLEDEFEKKVTQKKRKNKKSGSAADDPEPGQMTFAGA